MAKDISWFAWMVNILMEAKCEMVDTLFMYYLIIYMTQQLFLFIAMALQLIIKKLPGSYSEYAIATHTKYIGAVKLVLGIIGVICFLNNLINAVTLTVFLGIDIFLVPVVIQVTEIRADPNVIKPVKFQKTPEKS
ncbi:hypothetical protein GCK72_020786 [Caenorhabditis remanei]|uniref:Uncharacterized protein n=1 Tax=Caenorhabditis remanei TaxID=31234 RepID=A0A6A5GHT1_CAERE|nr:hypothetical protein GCK72_020786 [Caenorhabditis remanei]KAF1754226.1 hypothetical protein GCK72_020786 [Caenorhabditis remanei]